MVKKFAVKLNRNVYPPGEDTWFLTEFLTDFLSSYKINKYQKGVICEVGVGTAYILIYLSLRYSNFRFIGTDISPMAVSLSKKNTDKWIPNSEYYLCCMQFLNSFNSEKFTPDIIYFNPPYIRTSYEEYLRQDSPIIKTWAGGPGGISPILNYLDELIRFRFEYAFFLSSSLNQNAKFMTKSKLNIIEVARKKIENEHLIIYQATISS